MLPYQNNRRGKHRCHVEVVEEEEEEAAIKNLKKHKEEQNIYTSIKKKVRSYSKISSNTMMNRIMK